MIKEKAIKYYLDGDYNCAEAVLLGGISEWNLDLKEDSFKLLSAFGGGMGCGKTCGAIAAATSLLGYMTVGTKAHETEDFKETIGALVEELEKGFGSLNCDDIKPQMFSEESRCLFTVEKVCDILEKFRRENNL